MSEPTPEHKKRYEELMRGAGARRRRAAKRAIMAERRYRAQLHSNMAAKKRAQENKLRLAIERLTLELEHLQAKHEFTKDVIERVNIRAEIVHLQRVLKRLRGGKPPESGLPVPAVPPSGPLPKQGGAEAPLDFED